MTTSKQNVLLKIIVCGECRVGKSLICDHLSNGYNSIQNVRPRNYYEPTVGLDMAIVKRKIKHLNMKVHLWDTSGDDRYLGIVRSYYHSCCGAIIVIDMSDKDAHQHLKEWMQDLKHMKRKDDAKLIISVFANVENGKHPNNLTKKHCVEDYCLKQNAFYNEIKIANNEGINEMFDKLIEHIYAVYLSKGTRMDGVHYFMDGDKDYNSDDGTRKYTETIISSARLPYSTTTSIPLLNSNNASTNCINKQTCCVIQ